MLYICVLFTASAYLQKLLPPALPDISSYVEDIKQAVLYSKSGEDPLLPSSSSETSWSSLRSMFAVQRYDTETVARFHHTWEQLQSLTLSASVLETWANIKRGNYLTTYMMAYLWLEGFIDRIIDGIHEDESEKSEWYYLLGRAVYRNIKSKETNASYDPADYTASGALSSKAVKITLKFKKTVLGEDGILSQATDHLMQLLPRWLGFPDEPLLYAKARFLSVLYSYAGSGIFYLPATFHAFQYLKGNVLSRGVTTVSPSTFTSFVHQLENHPVFSSSSTEYASVVALGNVVKMPEVNPMDPSVWIDSNIIRFARFLLHLQPLTSKTSLDLSQDSLLPKVYSDLDTYLPFLDTLPSLDVLQSADPGPYSNDHIASREGVFSAILARNFTFGAPIITRDNQVFFTSAEHWEKAKRDAFKEGKAEDYFINRDVYGRATPRRFATKVTVESIWEAASDWAEFINAAVDPDDHIPPLKPLPAPEQHNSSLPVTQQQRENVLPGHQESQVLVEHQYNIPSLALFKFFSGERGYDHQDTFKTLGPLVAYQLVVDYIQAGVAVRPTLEEMAELILEVNGNAIRGLRKLDVLPRWKTALTSGDVLQALQKVLGCIEDNLPQDDQDAICLDSFTIERALSTFSLLEVDYKTEL